MVTCGKCQTLNADDAELCQQCAHELGRVCTACATRSPPQARFCCGCGARLAPAGDRQAAAAHLVAWPAAELRQITIFFCDVVGSSELSSRLDPEDIHALLREFHGACADIVNRHHGHVAQYLGDGLLAYFGYPVAMEDDARGAARAGLEIVQQASLIVLPALRREGIQLQVRVGIHTGRVVVGTVGNEGRHEALALGETPNIAARVQALAQPSTVVVTDTTRQLLGEQFRCAEIGKHELRGFRQPMRLYQVVAAEAASSAAVDTAPSSGPFVGRGRELAQLQERWHGSEAGAVRLVCVLGEPGMGKSRLLREFTRSLRPEGVTVLEGHCSPYHQGSAFHALAQCLEQDLGVAQDSGAEHKLRALQELPQADPERRALHVRLLAGVLRMPLPPDFPAVELPPPELRRATFEALLGWLAARRSPTLMVLEDLQWADPSTLEFLAHFAGVPTGEARLCVVTARPELELAVLALERTESLVLQRLSADDTELVARHLAGERRLSEPLLERLVAKGEGNPLFVEEMTRALFGSDALSEDELNLAPAVSADQLIPTTLQNTLTARLDLLGRAKPTVQLAAVLGREFRREVLEEVWKSVFLLSDFELERDLRQLIRSNLLYMRQDANGIEYGFKHALLQDAAYQSLLRTRRREYHRRVADVLRTRFSTQAELSPDLLAQHYSAAAQPWLAVEYWEKAGRQAAAVVAHQEAIGHYRAALDSLSLIEPSHRRSAKETDLLIALGVLYIQTKGFASPEVEQTYRRAVELCDETSETPLRVLYGLWAVNLVRSELEPTSRLVRHLERWLASDDVSTRLVCHACLGNWHFYRGNYPAAREHLERATALCDWGNPRRQHEQLLREHGFEGLLYGPLYLAWCLANQGDPGRAESTWQVAQGLAERIGDPYALVMARAFGATVHHALGNVDKMQELADQVLEEASKKGFSFWLATAQVTSGWALAMRGAADRGIPRIEEGLRMFRTIGARMPYPYYLSYLAEAHAVLGQLDAADAALDEALLMSASNVDCNHEPELLRQKAALCTRRGQSERAIELLSRARELSAAQGCVLVEWSVAEELALSLLAANRAEEASSVRQHGSCSDAEARVLEELYQRRRALLAAQLP